MTSSSDRTRAIFGYAILCLINIFELIVLIIGAISYGGQGNEICGGSIDHLTLAFWLFLGGIIGLIFGTLYLCLYTPSVCCDQVCCEDRGDHMSGMIMCLLTGPFAVAFFLIAILFRLVWFILGIIILSSVSEQCTIQHSGLKTLAIFYLVSMVFSTIGKALVSFSVCPCCK